MERDPFEENKEQMSLNAKPRSPDAPFQPLFWVEVVDFVRARLPTQQDERALERVLEDLLDDCVRASGGLGVEFSGVSRPSEDQRPWR